MQKLHNFKPIYHVGKKLHVLMVLEIVLLVSAYFLIIFFYDQNFQFQQNNSIYQLNHTLLLHTNSVLEKLNVTSEFPLARIADRHHDPLLLYLTAKNHGGISQTDFYRNFYKRTNEIFIQFPDTESIFLFDTDGNLLDSKTFQLLSPKKITVQEAGIKNVWITMEKYIFSRMMRLKICRLKKAIRMSMPPV